jgi:hypothetical protein
MLHCEVLINIIAKMSMGRRLWLMVKFAWAFVESAMVTLTRRLNRISRDYRYVMEVLTLEKKMLKVCLSFTVLS